MYIECIYNFLNIFFDLEDQVCEVFKLQKKGKKKKLAKKGKEIEWKVRNALAKSTVISSLPVVTTSNYIVQLVPMLTKCDNCVVYYLHIYM